MELQVKICGLTDPGQARFCAQLGVDALGLIFYPPSPRFVSPRRASELVNAVSGLAPVVGVFVNENPDEMIRIAAQAGFNWVQLHGNEPVETARALRAAGLRVIKVLRFTGDALLEAAARFAEADALLVEAGQGVLPGGNGATWCWEEAAPLAGVRPYALAGGLRADNIESAARGAQASLLDVSSGVEISPGVKDLNQVEAVVRAVREIRPTWRTGKVIT